MTPIENRLKSVEAQIRFFKPSDLPAVLEVERRVFPSPWTRLAFQFCHLRNPDGFLVAFKGGVLAGYAVVEVEENEASRSGHLLNLAVKPEFKGGGVGRRLMEGVFNLLREKKASSIRLEVRESNLEAQGFYEMMGFKREGMSLRYYGDEDAVLMRRNL